MNKQSSYVDICKPSHIDRKIILCYDVTETICGRCIFVFEKVVSPESLGVSSKRLLQFIDEVEKRGIEIHSLILLRHGREAVRMNWKPYDISAPHMLFSLSKSFTSCAAGFAVAEGLLTYDMRVADVLSDKLPETPSKRLLNIRLKDLLCMGSGRAPESDGTPKGNDDWCRYTLNFDIEYDPGTHFNYNSLDTYLCSAMVTRVTGMTVRDYLMPRLFDKIGIPKPDWDMSPQGINCGGWGLHLSCESIARFGQLLLNHGIWNGERILPAGWVETATSMHIDNSGRNQHADWEQGYCYQFWRCRDGRYRGDGMCGQYCLVSDREDAVMAMTAGTTDMGAQMDAVHDLLLGAIDAEPGTAAEQDKLRQCIATLGYSYPTDDGSGRDISGTYRSVDGHELTIKCCDDKVVITLKLENAMYGPMDYPIGSTSLCKLQIDTPGALEAEYALCGSGWHNGELTTALRLVNGPFCRIDKIIPCGDTLTVNSSGAGFGDGKTSKYKYVCA